MSENKENIEKQDILDNQAKPEGLEQPENKNDGLPKKPKLPKNGFNFYYLIYIF